MVSCFSKQAPGQPTSKAGATSKKAPRELPQPSAHYDEDLRDYWGGPMPTHFQEAMASWPAKYPQDRSENTGQKTALITGSTGGIGYYAAKLMAKCGFEIIMPKRLGFEAEAEKARDVILEEVTDAKVTILNTGLDLASYESVRDFAKEVRSNYEKLDILCLHAGRGGAKGDARTTTVDGHESIMQVNLLSHFLLASELMPLLRNSHAARVVVQTSGTRFDPFGITINKSKDIDGTKVGAWNAFDQYRVSKAGGCLFIRALNERLAAANVTNVTACVADPGLSATGVNAQHNLGHSMLLLPKGCLSTRRMHSFGQHAADGALPMVLACVEPNVAPNTWFTPKKGVTGVPAHGDAGGHVQAKIDPLNPKSAWPKDAPDVCWEQCVALSGAKWIF